MKPAHGSRRGAGERGGDPGRCRVARRLRHRLARDGGGPYPRGVLPDGRRRRPHTTTTDSRCGGMRRSVSGSRRILLHSRWRACSGPSTRPHSCTTRWATTRPRSGCCAHSCAVTNSRPRPTTQPAPAFWHCASSPSWTRRRPPRNRSSPAPESVPDGAPLTGVCDPFHTGPHAACESSHWLLAAWGCLGCEPVGHALAEDVDLLPPVFNGIYGYLRDHRHRALRRTGHDGAGSGDRRARPRGDRSRIGRGGGDHRGDAIDCRAQLYAAHHRPRRARQQHHLRGPLLGFQTRGHRAW